ncbi:MAG: glycosyltransferase family 39 protein [Myxococcaceae bacterium]|nr:glycosyltransferase family 39 protein [Myxococcaceae bacterium]
MWFRRVSPALPSVAFLVLLNVLFRLPQLINAGNVHSDAAIVGLQTEHLLRGEWSWFIWGTSYEGILDVLFLAPAFLIFGHGPLVLMAVPLALHIVANLLAWDVLRRRLSPHRAFLLSLVLVFTPQAINGVALYEPRQGSITCMFAAIWFFDRASSWKHPPVALAAGAVLLPVGLYADLFVLQMVVVILVFGILTLWDERPSLKTAAVRVAAIAVPFGIGLLALRWIQRAANVGETPTSLSWDQLGPNFHLLWDKCLGWVLGYKVYQPFIRSQPALWHPPGWFAVFQKVGAALFVMLILSALALVFARRIPWTLRRLGILGAGCAIASFVGFLLSTSPVDVWSARYLAPIVWMAPFALAPMAYRLTGRGAAVWLGPYLLTAAVGGWVSYAGSVDGFWPRLDPRGQAIDERELGAILRSKGVRAGMADYWLAYRLTYLWDEVPVLAPFTGWERYWPYREAASRADPYVLVFHPMEPFSRPEPFEQALRERQVPYDKVVVGDFTALIVRRR